MVIFNSYVKLPEGIIHWFITEKNPSFSLLQMAHLRGIIPNLNAKKLLGSQRQPSSADAPHRTWEWCRVTAETNGNIWVWKWGEPGVNTGIPINGHLEYLDCYDKPWEFGSAGSLFSDKPRWTYGEQMEKKWRGLAGNSCCKRFLNSTPERESIPDLWQSALPGSVCKS